MPKITKYSKDRVAFLNKANERKASNAIRTLLSFFLIVFRLFPFSSSTIFKDEGRVFGVSSHKRLKYLGLHVDDLRSILLKKFDPTIEAT